MSDERADPPQPPPLRLGSQARLARLALAMCLPLLWTLPFFFGLPLEFLHERGFLNSGLPCPFCGGTRAARHLLAGDWAAAWYFNPLVFPLLAATALIALVSLWEAARGRTLPRLHSVSRQAFFPLLLLLILFSLFHLSVALWTPKPELLDRKGWIMRHLGQE